MFNHSEYHDRKLDNLSGHWEKLVLCLCVGTISVNVCRVSYLLNLVSHLTEIRVYEIRHLFHFGGFNTFLEYSVVWRPRLPLNILCLGAEPARTREDEHGQISEEASDT